MNYDTMDNLEFKNQMREEYLKDRVVDIQVSEKLSEQLTTAVKSFSLDKDFDELIKEETLRKHLISENKNNDTNYKISKSTVKKDRLQIGSYKFKQNKNK